MFKPIGNVSTLEHRQSMAFAFMCVPELVIGAAAGYARLPLILKGMCFGQYIGGNDDPKRGKSYYHWSVVLMAFTNKYIHKPLIGTMALTGITYYIFLEFVPRFSNKWK